MTQLTENFSLAELTRSSTADRLGIDNTPDDEQTRNLRAVCEHVLQPIRDSFKKPVNVSSGLRVLELNRAIGSNDTSQHTKGQAVDFEIWGVSNHTLAKWIQDNLLFDQLILEFYQRGVPNSGWVHCSYVVGDNRKKVGTIIKGSGYVGGLVL